MDLSGKNFAHGQYGNYPEKFYALLKSLKFQQKSLFGSNFNFDSSKLPVSRQVSRKAQFTTFFQDKVGKIRTLTGTLVYKERVDEAFVFIDKLISE